MLKIWFNVILQNILTQTMKTLLVIITKNVGHVMLVCVSWSMMLIWVALSFGTSRIVSQGRCPLWDGRIVLCLCTAKTTPTCCSTCVALNADCCPRSEWQVKSSPTETVYGIFKMRYRICHVFFLRTHYWLVDQIIYFTWLLCVVGRD